MRAVRSLADERKTFGLVRAGDGGDLAARVSSPALCSSWREGEWILTNRVSSNCRSVCHMPVLTEKPCVGCKLSVRKRLNLSFCRNRKYPVTSPDCWSPSVRLTANIRGQSSDRYWVSVEGASSEVNPWKKQFPSL